jgi:FtsP/CotA-like multicopper oxidase with cupredoxin domain
VLIPAVENGVKVFRLEASLIKWTIAPGVQVTAYAFNRQVPGPTIRVWQGDRVRILVTNKLPGESTSVHWHGLEVPNAMDGAAGVTQPPIRPGQTYRYEFTVRQAGTFFYHSHYEVDRQQALGLYGAFIATPSGRSGIPAYNKEATVQLQEWAYQDGYTFPAMPQDGAFPNYFTINGKAYPATQPIALKQGQRLLLRFIGSSTGFIHPMHIHGGPFTIVAEDGVPVPRAAQVQKDTINVGPEERYDVIWTARATGTWLLHCHITHHITNNDTETQGGGGLTIPIKVS